MAAATPPPCISRVLAALAMASTSSWVMSASRTSISVMAANYGANVGTATLRAKAMSLGGRRGPPVRAARVRCGPQRRSARALTDFRRLFFAGQPLAPAPHRANELGQIDLERVEDLIGVVLGTQPNFPFPRPGLLDDVLGRALGLLGDLLLGDHAVLALAGFGHDPLGLPLGLGQHLLAFLDDPPGLLDLLGDRGPHLVEDVVDLLLVHAHLIGQRDRLCV